MLSNLGSKYLRNGGTKLKRKIKHKLLEFLSPALVSVQKSSDQKFLELFNIKDVANRISKDDVSSAVSCLIDHYSKKVKFRWLLPPKTITDLRLDLDQISREKLIHQADSILQFRFMPNNHFPRITVDENIDWHFNPISSREWLLRLHRHQWWPILGLAYHNTGDERYANAFVNQMMDWISKNPPPNQKDERNHAWRLMEVGLRLRVSWIPSFGLFFQSPLFDNKAKLKMLRSIYDHASFLFLFKTNRNHLLRESNGLLYTSVYFPEFKKASLWQNEALKRIDKEIAKQINQDGSHIEVSTGYQWLVIDELEKTYDLLNSNNLKLPSKDLEALLEKMYGVLANLIRPDGTFPEINDGFIRWDFNRLADAGRKFNRKDFIYIGTRGEEGSKPGSTSKGLKDAGFYIMRNDWTKDASYLLFNAGPYGGPHGHEDKLSIEVAAFGQSFVVDSGSYTYEKTDPYRVYFVGSQAHNTVLVDGFGQIRRWQKKHMHPERGSNGEGVWISNTGFDYAASSYSEGYSTFLLKKPENPEIIENVTHTRRIIFVKPDYWIMIDNLEAPMPHQYQLLFHVPHDVAVHVCPELKVELSGTFSAARLHIVPMQFKDLTLSLECGSESPIQGWLSIDHHCKVPSTAIIYESQKKSSAVFTTLLFPIAGEQINEEKLIQPIKVTGQNNLACAVSSARGVDYLMFSNDHAPKQFATFESAGIIAVFRTDHKGKLWSSFEGG